MRIGSSVPTGTKVAIERNYIEVYLKGNLGIFNHISACTISVWYEIDMHLKSFQNARKTGELKLLHTLPAYLTHHMKGLFLLLYITGQPLMGVTRGLACTCIQFSSDVT